ncbi:hypothetical protein ABPG72_009168 [Tetrahymena utriculariae]
MSLMRSDRMAYYNIVIPRESAWEVLNQLGQVQVVQFEDQNAHENHLSRVFTPQIKRAEDILNQLNTIHNEMIKKQKEIIKCDNVQAYLEVLEVYLRGREKAYHTFIDDVEAQVRDTFAKLNEQTFTLESLSSKYYSLIEYSNVLRKFKEKVVDQRILSGLDNIAINPLDQSEEGKEEENPLASASKLFYITGTINKEDNLRFKKIIFRTTKGNSWVFTSEIPYDQGEFKEGFQKSVFIVAFSGGSGILKSKLNRVCDSFNASKYSMPRDPNGYNNKFLEIQQQITDTRQLMRLTENALNNILDEWIQPRIGNQCSYIEELRLYVVKEKYIYTNMNMLTVKSTVFGGYFWCPEEQDHAVLKAIDKVRHNNPNIGMTEVKKQERPSHLEPPTHFRTNDVTAPFQEIVNTYGIPRYREVNPGLFCISMFPLKFGIMFGDIGHGGALLAFGAWLVYKGKELLHTPLAALYPARYLLAMLGIFAFYCGFIYNDFLALPINLFGSCYYNVHHDGEAAEGQAHYVIEKHENCVYPLGFDPKWYISSNELNFFNSFKMKFAVIFGVVQMSWGIFLKGLNCIHFDLWVDLIFEWLPQMVFLLSTFGYMCFMIIFKWVSQYEEGYLAPSIINQMINLPLKMGQISSFNGTPTPLFNDSNFQEELQYNLLIISIACVPTMLLVKPLFFLLKKKPQHQELHDESEPLLQQSHAPPSHDDHDFGEVFVHQIIETIEFVLGSISNTASYLRLWALSLAHGQLAKVFFEKTIGGGIVGGSALQIIIGWFLFLNISFAVLMCMDLMECFLHALRLQWVEFQNKFYKADGYVFQPFSFVDALNHANEAEQAK